MNNWPENFLHPSLCEKRKAFGDVIHFSFVLEEISLQIEGSSNSCRFFVGPSLYRLPCHPQAGKYFVSKQCKRLESHSSLLR